jgi:metal-sulfur cluster biosynthetic enzyme
MEKQIAEEDVIKALRGVIDPEMHIDIYTLGLIYRIAISDTGVHILMTLTTPLCPYADEIVEAVRHTSVILGTPVTVELTFAPPWVPPQNLRSILGV